MPEEDTILKALQSRARLITDICGVEIKVRKDTYTKGSAVIELPPALGEGFYASYAPGMWQMGVEFLEGIARGCALNNPEKLKKIDMFLETEE